MIKKIFLSLMMVCFSAPIFASLPPLKVAVEGTYPPFSYMSAAGELKGFDVDITKALCTQMDRECKIITQNWEGLVPSLQEHKIDFVVASISITPTRQKVVAFSDPYYYEYAVFVGPKTCENEAIEKISHKDLVGKKIGVQTGTSFAIYAGEYYTKFADVVYYGSQEDANLDLIAGRLDYIFVNAVSINYSLLSRKKGEEFQIVGEVIEDPDIVGKGVGIAIRQDDDALKSELDAALLAIKKNGVYGELTQHYFGY